MSAKVPTLEELKAEVGRARGHLSLRSQGREKSYPRPRERRALYVKIRAYYLARREEEATQEEIARELGIPPSTLHRWIRAYLKPPEPCLLDRLAEQGLMGRKTS